MKHWIKLLLLANFLSLNFLSADQFQNTFQEHSLLHYAYPIYSQYGEEGVVDEIMRKLDIKNGFLVEFGGYDGLAMSNTRFLAERGWRGVFIESDYDLYIKMKENLRHQNILCLNEWITPFEKDTRGLTIDTIADRYFPTQEIDVMCIDIDGLDHLVLQNLKRKPKLIIIEGGMFWHPQMQNPVPEYISALDVQQPLSVMTKIAQEKGYELICSTFNAFFIRRDYYHLFSEIDNDPSKIWWEALLNIRNFSPQFYHEILFRIRKLFWINDLEKNDPNITFDVVEKCKSLQML